MAKYQRQQEAERKRTPTRNSETAGGQGRGAESRPHRRRGNQRGRPRRIDGEQDGRRRRQGAHPRGGERDSRPISPLADNPRQGEPRAARGRERQHRGPGGVLARRGRVHLARADHQVLGQSEFDRSVLEAVRRRPTRSDRGPTAGARFVHDDLQAAATPPSSRGSRLAHHAMPTEAPGAWLSSLLAGGVPLRRRPRPPYQDPSQPVDARVADLLKRMTLEEKVAQLQGFLVQRSPRLRRQGQFRGRRGGRRPRQRRGRRSGSCARAARRRQVCGQPARPRSCG